MVAERAARLAAGQGQSENFTDFAHGGFGAWHRLKPSSIISDVGALGVTIRSPIDDRFNYGEDYFRARIVGADGVV